MYVSLNASLQQTWCAIAHPMQDRLIILCHLIHSHKQATHWCNNVNTSLWYYT